MFSLLAISGVVRYDKAPSLFRTNEEHMPKKCAICAILLDIPCVTVACPGHHNESVGDMCAYCVANEREEVLALRHFSPSLVSSLDDGEPDVEDA